MFLKIVFVLLFYWNVFCFPTIGRMLFDYRLQSFKISPVLLVYQMAKCLYFYHIKSAAVQSGERTMHYGKSIDDGENYQGQIPRLLGNGILSSYLFSIRCAHLMDGFLHQFRGLFYLSTGNMWFILRDVRWKNTEVFICDLKHA